MRRARLYVILSAREVSLFLPPPPSFSLYRTNPSTTVLSTLLFYSRGFRGSPRNSLRCFRSRAKTVRTHANERESAGYAKERADLLADSSLRSGLFREREREKIRSVRSDKKRKRERNERKKKNIPARPEAFSERGTYRAAKRYSDFAVASAIPRSVTKVQAIGIIANANERNKHNDILRPIGRCSPQRFRDIR